MHSGVPFAISGRVIGLLAMLLCSRGIFAGVLGMKGSSADALFLLMSSKQSAYGSWPSLKYKQSSQLAASQQTEKKDMDMACKSAQVL
jgi:hypothetical protein